MTSFRYEAVDAGGRKRRGVISADTPRRARREIVGAGLTPISLKSVSERSKTGEAGRRWRRPSHRDVITATRQIATLIDASTPVEEALAAVGGQMKGSPISEVLLSIRSRIIEGWRLSDAMAEYPKSFTPLYRSVIAAGESSSTLGTVMLRLADMLEKNRAMLTKATTSMIYPAAVLVIALLVVAALMNIVVPKIVGQFAASGGELPWLTTTVIGISEFMQAWGWLIALIILACGVAAWQARRYPQSRRAMDKALLRLPVIGKLARELDAARFARTLSTLFSSGTPLLDSLQASRRTVTNSYIAHRLEKTLASVREGGSVSLSIRRADVFPLMMTSMIAAGERSGQLPALLDKTADQMESSFDTAVSVALRLLEPAVIVLLGGVVLVIILAIMMPILQLNSLAL